MKLYLAGPLFTQAERAWNLRLAELLSEAGHILFLPQDEVQEIAALNAEAVFGLDVDGVRSADAVVAILDGADADSGTAFECGLAFALGIPIVAVRTDFRAGGDALPRQKLASVNLMLAQAAAAVVAVTQTKATPEDLASEVARALDHLPASLPPVQRPRPEAP